MTIIICLIIIVVIGVGVGYNKLNNAARKEEQRKVKREYENLHFELYVATKDDTEAERRVALAEEIYYRHGLPAPSQEAEVARKLRKRIWEEAGIQPTAEMITCAMLVQRGKLPYDLSWTTYVPTPIEPRRKHWEVEHKFLKWLDKEQMNHDIPFRIKFVPSGENIRDAESFSSDQITLRMGKYIWNPDQFIGSATLIKETYDYNAPFVDYK